MDNNNARSGRVAGLFLIAALVGVVGAGLTWTAFASFPYFTAFSLEEDYVPGPLIGSRDGWEVRIGDGKVDILPDSEASGDQVLRLPGGRPSAIVERRFETGPEADIVFVELTIRPVVGETVPASTRIIAGGAAVAFVRTSATHATLLVRDGYSGAWIDTQRRLPLLDNRQTQELYRLTLRVDRDHGVADIFLDGLLLDYDLGLREETSFEEFRLRVIGGRDGETIVGDVLTSEHNPIAQDLLGSGIPDDWLVERGIDPAQAHRYEDFDGDGRWLIEEYFAELRPDYTPIEVGGRDDAGEAKPVPRLLVFTPLERRLDSAELLNDVTTEDL